MPQARQWKVASSGKPSNRAVRLASRINCAQLGQRGVASVELGALVSHMVVIPGLWLARSFSEKSASIFRVTLPSGTVLFESWSRLASPK
jgi:hypothetical protein